jgi:exonuclease III
MRFNVLSWNVRGINDPQKRKEALNTALFSHADIICLQETWLSPDNLTNDEIWKGPQMWSCDDNQQRHAGVAFLCKKWIAKLNPRFREIIPGRCISLDIQIDGADTRIMTTYMSLQTAGSNTRIHEYELISKEMESAKRIIICGDFNALLDASTEWSGSSTRNDKPFVDWKIRHKLQDPWKTLNPHSLGATCRRHTKSGFTWSRIDRFLCSRDLHAWFKKLKTVYSALSDHSAILANIDSAGGCEWQARYIDWRAYNDSKSIEDIQNKLRAYFNTPGDAPIEAEWSTLKKKLSILLIQKSSWFKNEDGEERKELERE